ncbi:MAG: ABC transporter ATP-binding protein [Oscillibacter sp.]|nr:ABC transporter ATP-binding protein [Oscillibacter sp.]
MVEMKGITKRFPGVTANQDVSIQVKKGEIYGLIGENGAGKTTLMKILYGMYRPDEGEIFINGQKVVMHSPKDAISHGIGMVHQHFTLVPSFTVTQNIMLGRPITKHGLLDFKRAEREIRRLGETYRLEADPHMQVKDLPVAMQQRVEILKALYLGADILIMDEPTAVLTPQEITQLLETFHSLKEQGKSIILITHKLKELMGVTDTITVLRNGKVTGVLDTARTSEKEIASLMVGKEIDFFVQKTPSKPKEEVLRCEGLNYWNRFGVKMLDDVSFSIRRGEIVGIAGVQGNGQTELIEALAGIVNDYTGKIFIGDAEIAPESTPGERRSSGLSHIPEDRQTTGAALTAPLVDNFIMGGTRDPAYAGKYLINYKKAAAAAQEQYALFDVKLAGVDQPAYALSGGNLQKAIVAREMYRNPEVLIAAQPSRGVDIGATLFIHEKLVELRDSGKAVLLVSGELSEIMSLSDRILVMYKGGIIGETTPEESTEEDIGLMMLGIKEGGTA